MSQPDPCYSQEELSNSREGIEKETKVKNRGQTVAEDTKLHLWKLSLELSLNGCLSFVFHVLLPWCIVIKILNNFKAFRDKKRVLREIHI